jgi:hypothetical protein
MGGITMTGTAKVGTAGQSCAVFAIDEDGGLAALEEAWADGGCHTLSADPGTWSAIIRAGQVLTGATPDELDRTIRARWQARQSQGAGR